MQHYAAIVPSTFSKCCYSSKIAVNQDRVRIRCKQSWEGEGKRGGGGLKRQRKILELRGPKHNKGNVVKTDARSYLEKIEIKCV